MEDCLQTHHQQLVPSLWHMPPLRTSRVCFPSFHSADFVTCFQQQDAVETTLSHFGGHWPLQGWQLLLLSFRKCWCHVSQAGLPNEERSHEQRKSQPGPSCSIHPGEAWDTWVKPSWISELPAEWVTPAETSQSRTAWVRWAWPVHGSMRNNKSVSAKSWDDFSRQRRIIKIFLNFYYVFYILHVIYGLLKD